MIVVCQRALADGDAAHVAARLLVCRILDAGHGAGTHGDTVVGPAGRIGTGGDGVGAMGAGIGAAGLRARAARPGLGAKRHGITRRCVGCAALGNAPGGVNHRVLADDDAFDRRRGRLGTDHNRIINSGAVGLAVGIGIPANDDGVLVTAFYTCADGDATFTVGLGLRVANGGGIGTQTLDVVANHHGRVAFGASMMANGDGIPVLGGRIWAYGNRINGGRVRAIVVFVALVDATIIDADIAQHVLINLILKIGDNTVSKINVAQIDS